jgi:hypothetical protein
MKPFELVGPPCMKRASSCSCVESLNKTGWDMLLSQIFVQNGLLWAKEILALHFRNIQSAVTSQYLTHFYWLKSIQVAHHLMDIHLQMIESLKKFLLIYFHHQMLFGSVNRYQLLSYILTKFSVHIVFCTLGHQSCEADHSPLSSAKVKNDGAVPPLPHVCSWQSSWLITHRDFTLLLDIFNLRPPKHTDFTLTTDDWSNGDMSHHATTCPC